MTFDTAAVLLQAGMGVVWLLLAIWALRQRLWLTTAAASCMLAKAVVFLVVGPVTAFYVLAGVGLTLMLTAFFAVVGRKMAEDG
jgi:hypothetical protein